MKFCLLCFKINGEWDACEPGKRKSKLTNLLRMFSVFFKFVQFEVSKFS